MISAAPVALYDSGLGGLSVVREVLRQLPDEPVIYFGDTARVPYGGRDQEELIDFNREILDILVASGVKAIVVACNTSSALALPYLEDYVPVPILGILDAGARAAALAGGRIGVIATRATIASGAYEAALRRHGHAGEVIPRACAALVPMIESGVWEGAEAEAIVADSLGPLLDLDLDTLVLGCTHYPFVAPVIRRLMGPEVQLIDPAREAVRSLALMLEARGLEATLGPVRHRIMVSGDPRSFDRLAERLLGPGLPASEQVAVAEAQPVAV